MSNPVESRNAGPPRVRGHSTSTACKLMALFAGISPKNPLEEVITTRQDIDAEIEAALLVVQVMRSRRNELSPIAVLPPEMLAQIFEFAVLLDPPTMQTSEWGVRGSFAVLGWIGVTHVCRAWRHVAFQHPRLWSNIVFTLGPTWTDAFLTRAKSSALCIKTTTDDTQTIFPGGAYGIYNERLFDASMLRSHLWHTAELNLTGAGATLSPALQTLIVPAPKLEVLNLVAQPTGGFYPHTRPALPLSLCNNAPSLRHLTLNEIAFSWASIAFRTLSSLDITFYEWIGEETDPHPAPNDAQSFSALLTALQVMPGLETLSLGGCLPVGSPSDASSVPSSVELPRLASLKLAGPAERLYDLWRLLRVSPLARLVLRCTSEASPPEAIYDVLSLLNAHLSSPQRDAIPIRTFCLECSPDESGMLIATGWRRSKSKKTSADAFAFREATDVTLELFLDSDAAFSPIILRVRQAFPLEHLHALRLEVLSIETRWTKRCWIEQFGGCKALEHVCVAGEVAYGFCRALGARRTRGQGEGPVPQGATFLPALRYVSLGDVDFREDCNVEPLYEALPKWLDTRATAVGRLKHIDIVRCTVEDEWVEDLVGLARTVTWDDSHGDLHGKYEGDESLYTEVPGGTDEDDSDESESDSDSESDSGSDSDSDSKSEGEDEDEGEEESSDDSEESETEESEEDPQPVQEPFHPWGSNDEPMDHLDLNHEHLLPPLLPWGPWDYDFLDIGNEDHPDADASW